MLTQTPIHQIYEQQFHYLTSSGYTTNRYPNHSWQKNRWKHALMGPHEFRAHPHSSLPRVVHHFKHGVHTHFTTSQSAKHMPIKPHSQFTLQKLTGKTNPPVIHTVAKCKDARNRAPDGGEQKNTLPCGNKKAREVWNQWFPFLWGVFNGFVHAIALTYAQKSSYVVVHSIINGQFR